MKQFSLEEYLKNPERKVVTRDGRSVRIKCTDKKSDYYPIVALIDLGNLEDICSFSKNGEYWIGSKTKLDLFFIPEKHEGWINIYSDSYFSASSRIFSSKEDAEKEGKKWKDYVATIKIEWET